MSAVLDGIQGATGSGENREQIITGLSHLLDLLLALPYPQEHLPVPAKGFYPQAVAYLQQGLVDRPDRWTVLLAAGFLHQLGNLAGKERASEQTLSWLEEWHIARKLNELAGDLGIDPERGENGSLLLRLLVSQETWYEKFATHTTRAILEAWISDPDIQRYLGINRFQDVLWFNAERMQDFAWWMTVAAVLHAAAGENWTSVQFLEVLLGSYGIAQEIQDAADESEFRLTRLLEGLE